MLSKNFLISFDAKVKNLMRKGPLTQEEILEKLTKKNITFYGRTRNEISKTLAEIENVLDKILSICYKPKFITDTRETMLRSEQSPSISVEHFQKTLRDSSLWKQKGNEMSPEYLHSSENNDTIITYENKFIVLLTRYIAVYIKSIYKLYFQSNSSLYYYYRVNELTYGYSSTIRDLENNIDNLSEFLFKSKTTATLNVDELFDSVLNKLKRIQATNFYIEVAKEKINLPIIQTNILIHEPLYNYCYKYYKNNIELYSSSFDMDLLYFNYVTYRVLRYWLDQNINLGKKFILDFKDDRLYIKDLKIRQSGFDISINTINNLLRVEVNKDNISTKYNLIPVIDVVNENKSLEEINIYLALTNQSNNFDNVCLVSYYKNIDNNHELDTLFKSFVISFKNPKKELYHCPICGSPNIKFENDIVECGNCHSQFVSYKRYRKNYTWIKKIGTNLKK